MNIRRFFSSEEDCLEGHLSRVLFGDPTAPRIEQDYVLFLLWNL